MKRSFKLIILFSILFILSSFIVNAFTPSLCWSYDETTGDLIENCEQSGDYDMTRGGSTATGKFNAGQDYENTANAAQRDIAGTGSYDLTGNQVVLGAWFKPESYPGAGAYNAHVMMTSDTYTNSPHIFIKETDNKWGCADGNGLFYYNTGSANNGVNLGNWQHVVCVFNDDDVYLYIDGDLKGSTTVANRDYTDTLALKVGYQGTSRYDGIADEIFVHIGTMTGTEVTEVYDRTVSWASSPAPEAADNFLIGANSTKDNTNIHIFNATIGATTYQTYNGTIHTPLLSNATSLYDITIKAPSYISKEYNNVNVSTSLTANLTPVNLEGLSISNYVTLSGINYTRSLTYKYNYTCESSGTTNFYRIINGIVNKTSALSCDNTTKTANDYFNYSIEGRYNISFDYNTTFGNSTTTTQTYYISDLINPVVNNISFVFGEDFVLPTANISMVCIDNIIPTLEYNLLLNSGEIFLGNKTNNTIQTNTTTALINGINNLTGICSDPFGSSQDSLLQNIELRTLYIINEQTNLGFNVQNLTSVRVYLDDNRTSYDFKANNKQNISFISTSDVKLRFELIYTDGTIILRYVDIGLLEDDIRVCANVEGITHYEQILTSSATRPVILKSVFADCLVAADYTRFAYQNSKVLKAYTYNNLYYLYTFANNDPDDTQTILASVDGSIATYINLDSLEFNEEGYNIAQTGDALSFYKRNANEVEIYYFNGIQKNNDALRIVITNTEDNSVYFNSTAFSDPNEAQIIFNIATLGLNETSILKATATRTINGEDSNIVGYFNINGVTGFINSGMMFILSIIILLFGLSLTAASRTFGWFGLFIIIFNIGVLSFAASAWYVTFMQAINIICMVYIFLVMTGKNTAQIG